MKKSLFLTFFFPPEKGGIQNYLYNICNRLPCTKVVVLCPPRLVKSSKLKVKSYNIEEEDETNKFDKRQDFKIIRKSYISPLRVIGLTSLHNFIMVAKIIKKYQIELIQCGHVHPHGLTAYFCKKIFNIPYIIYTHGTEILELEKDLKIKKNIIKKVLDNAQNIIVTTEFMRNYLDDKFGINNVDKNIKADVEDKIIKIPPGVDNDFFRPLNVEELRNKFNLQNKKILLTCGRLVERKGHELILKALPNLIKKFPNLLYWIVGSGPNEEKLKMIIRNFGLENYVKIFNNVKDNELNFYYNICDVFVMPAKSNEEKKDIEGFGMVYLEANACAKPVIGGNSGGVAEAIIDGQNGILVNPESIKEISEAIIKLFINKKLAKEMGDFGRERVMNEFCWDRLIKERLVDLLE